MKTLAPVSVLPIAAPSFFSASMMKNVWTAFEVARERRALTQMSDEALNDIGLSRIDAEREASRSFWDLPAFIRTLESTGFSSLGHRMYFLRLLAQPLLLASMVLFAAAFSLRQTRRGGTAMMMLAGVITGFILFILNDVVIALGLTEAIPAMLAAWSPACFALLIGTGTLLHLEDG